MIQANQLQEAAQKREKSNWRFYSFLKRYADPEELDHQFQRLHRELFSQFDCAGCRNCCKELSGAISEEELDGVAEYLGISAEELIEKYLDDKDEDTWPVRNRPCDFLQEDGSCRLADRKPASCRRYPFTDEPNRIGHLHGVLSAVSVCPVVFELFERLKQEYGFAEFDHPVPKIPADVLPDKDDRSDRYADFLFFLADAIRYEDNAEKLRRAVEEDTPAEAYSEIMDACAEAETMEDASQLVDRLRKEQRILVQQALCRRALELENETVPLLLRRFKTNSTTLFLQAASCVLANAEPLYALSLLKDYREIRSETARAYVWMVFGMKTVKEAVPLLLREWQSGKKNEDSWNYDMLRRALSLLYAVR